MTAREIFATTVRLANAAITASHAAHRAAILPKAPVVYETADEHIIPHSLTHARLAARTAEECGRVAKQLYDLCAAGFFQDQNLNKLRHEAERAVGSAVKAAIIAFQWAQTDARNLEIDTLDTSQQAQEVITHIDGLMQGRVVDQYDARHYIKVANNSMWW